MFECSNLNELVTKYHENKLAHAYLIETNNLEKALIDLKKLIKIINCPEDYNPTCTNCNLCNLINLSNLPSLKIISPDGQGIKKNQIEELKQDFSTIPLYSKYNTYIIMNAEKLNSSSANSMLKFVEEPTTGILGFFLTNNKDIIIDTIKSRCQTITLNYSLNSLESSLNISNEDYEKYKSIIPKYLNYLKKSTLENKKELLLAFPNREDIEKILKIILSLYYNYFLKLTNEEYDENIISLYPLNENITQINQKLQIITKILTNMSYNVSIELILDKFNLEMRGIS